MFCIFYQWRIHPDKHAEFTSAWEAITKHYAHNHGSLGSRLHHVSDDVFAAYAQWPDQAARDRAFDADDAPAAARAIMSECIAKRFEAIEMSVSSDRLLSGEHQNLNQSCQA